MTYEEALEIVINAAKTFVRICEFDDIINDEERTMTINHALEIVNKAKGKE